MPRQLVAFALLASMGAAILTWWVLRAVQQFDASGDDGHMEYPIGVRHLADAIAYAEGFGRPGAIPTRANNPGDLVIPGWTGESLGAQQISVFPTIEEGWRRLYRQLDLILNGQSHVYTRGADETIHSIATRWTLTESHIWASNVVFQLQSRWSYHDVTVDTRIGDLV